MNIVHDTKELSHEIGKNVNVIGKKISNAFDEFVNHLPFSNYAKKHDGNLHIEVDLPGVNKEEIDIKIEEGLLTVSAERRYKYELSKKNYYICESSFGKIQREFILPENIDEESINASFKDGRLEISLQKTPKAKPKTINIT